MKQLFIRSLIVCACLLALSFGAHAQANKNKVARRDNSAAGSVLGGAGNAAVIIVGSAAKIAWGTTKFIAKDVAMPVATGLLKPIATKTAPAIAKFALKKSAKYLLPLAVKLSIL